MTWLFFYFLVLFVGNVILSADYSQLELRILAHFSQDPDLLSSIKNEADVFVSIASKWNKISLNQVSYEICDINEAFSGLNVFNNV